MTSSPALALDDQAQSSTWWDTRAVAVGFQRDDERWNSRLQQVLDHLSVHGKMPRINRSASADERVLARWLTNQRHEHSSGLVPPDRVAKLEEDLPGWNGPPSLS